MPRFALAVLTTLAMGVLGGLTTGCAYEFGDKFWVTDLKFRRDVQKPLFDMHDLEKGTATMIILRDQVTGTNIGSGETLKLGFELQKYEVGKQISLPSDDVIVRFGILDGIPAHSGRISNLVLDGTIVVLKRSKLVLVIQVDMIMQMAELGTGSSEVTEEVIEATFTCQRINNDLDQIPPYYGGQQGIYTDEPPPRRDD